MLWIRRRAAKQFDTVFETCDLMEVSGVQIDAQIPYGGGRGYEVLADPHRSLWNLMLSPTRGAPEGFRLGGDELDSITTHPQCNFI